MRKSLLLVLLVVPYILSSCGGGKNYESFVQECQKGVYEDQFSTTEFGTLDKESVKEMVSKVDDTQGYISLKYALVDNANPTTINCRQREGATYTNTPGFSGWDKVDGNRNGESLESWE